MNPSGAPDIPPDIPPEIAFQAQNPSAAGPEPHPESGSVRVLTSAYCVHVTPMPTVNFVEMLDVSASDVEAVVDEVRVLLRSHGRGQAAWSAPETAGDVLAALTAAGMTPYSDSPLEPQYAAMALIAAPAGEPSDVVVRRAASVDDFGAIGELVASVFGMGADDRAGLVATLERRFRLQQEGKTHMTNFLAEIDGKVVGEGQAGLTSLGANLSGSSVHPQFRGRGVYRALVAARWQESVERGLPALTVQAGSMSRPILERLGFQTVARVVVLCDRFS